MNKNTKKIITMMMLTGILSTSSVSVFAKDAIIKQEDKSSVNSQIMVMQENAATTITRDPQILPAYIDDINKAITTLPADANGVVNDKLIPPDYIDGQGKMEVMPEVVNDKLTPPVYIDGQVIKDISVPNVPTVDGVAPKQESVTTDSNEGVMDKVAAPQVSEQKVTTEANKIKGKGEIKGKSINKSNVKAVVDNIKVEVKNAKTKIESNASNAKGFVTEYSKKVQDILPKASITMAAEQSSYPVNSESIKVNITNGTTKESGYGYEYRIEYFNGQSWEKVPLDVAFIEPYLILKAGEVQRQTISLYQNQYKYVAGKYRVVKNIGGQDITAEFTLK